MRTYKQKIGKIDYKVEDFESVLELTRVNNARKVKDEWKDYHSSGEKLKECIKDNPSWYGVSTYEEAYELLSTGWSEGIEQAKIYLKDIQNGEKKKIQFTNEVEGFIPNVALSLMNVPNAMINTRTTTVKSKVIDIIYDNTASASVSVDNMIKAGINLVGFVTDLEMSGYRCNIKASISAVHDRKVDICAVKIKSANQSFNLKKMMFPLAHSAWLRVVGFDWQDKSPIASYCSGRGYPYGIALEDNEVNRTDLQEVFKNKSYVITYKDAINGKDYLKNLLKK